MKPVSEIYQGDEFNIFKYSPSEEILSLLIIALLPCIALFLIFHLRKYLKKNRDKVYTIFLANLLFLFFFASLIFFAGEIYFRYIFDSTDSTISTRSSRKWFRQNYHTNKSGFRDNLEYSNIISSGKRRITFIGDSFTAGHGLKLDKRFANLIREANPEIEIHVMAVPGWNMKQYLELVQNLAGSGYQFDKVVIVFFINDIESYDKNPVSQDFYILKSPILKPLRYSYFGDQIVFRIEVLLNKNLKNYSEKVNKLYFDSSILSQLSSDLLQIKNIIEARKGEFYLVIFPLLQSTDKNKDTEKEIHKILEQICLSSKIKYLALKNVFEKSEDNNDFVINSYDAHPNENAHFIAALEIGKFISDYTE